MTTEQVTPAQPAPDPNQPDPQGQPPTDPQTPDPAPTEPPKGPDPNAELRAHADRTEAAAKEMRDQLMEVRLKDLGLQKTVGVGKAIDQGYKGTDMSLQAVAEYAKTEWGHEVAVTPQTQVVAGADAVSALDGVQQTTTPSQTPDEYQRIQSQMLDPEKIDRPLVEQSIASKIGHYFFPRQGQ